MAISRSSGIVVRCHSCDFLESLPNGKIPRGSGGNTLGTPSRWPMEDLGNLRRVVDERFVELPLEAEGILGNILVLTGERREEFFQVGGRETSRNVLEVAKERPNELPLGGQGEIRELSRAGWIKKPDELLEGD